MGKFVFSNTKNANIDHILFELNYGYNLKALFEDKTDLCLRFCSTNKLAKKLKELIEICCQNLLHVQEL